MSKVLKMQLLFVGTIVPIMFTIYLLVISNKASLSISGFAVDSNEMVYVGKEQIIEVYNDDVVIKKIQVSTSSSYSFTIRNDMILLAEENKIYTLDLDGNVINEYDDPSGEARNDIYKNRKKFKTTSGAEYKSSSLFGFYFITRKSGASVSVVYKISLLDYIVRLAAFLVCVSFIVFIPIIIYEGRKAEGISLSKSAENFMKAISGK